RSYRHWWPRYVILRRRRCNLRRCRAFGWLLLREFAGAAFLPLLLLDVGRRRGESACHFGHSLWLGRHRRLWLGLVRNWRFWRSRGRHGLTAVQPRKIIGTPRRGGERLPPRPKLFGQPAVPGSGGARGPHGGPCVFFFFFFFFF